MLLGEFKEYRGYRGTINYVGEGVYNGVVIGEPLITDHYEASDVLDLYVAFCDLVDAKLKYMEFEENLRANKGKKIKMDGLKVKIK